MPPFSHHAAPAADFDSYECYYSQRLLPGATLLSYAGIGVVALFLLADLWRLGPAEDFAGLALGSGVGALFIIWMARSMQHPAYARGRVHWILWLGNLAMLAIMSGNIVVLGRLSYLPMTIMYFMLGVLLIAPLVSPIAFLLPHLTTMLLVGLVLLLDGYHLQHWLELLLFSMPAMTFMLVILNVQRRTAWQSYLLARQNWYYATTDVLSQLKNRHTWYLQAEAAWQAAQTQPGPLALLMLDVDHFKQVNDSLGHAAGDHTIARIGQLMLAHCPPGGLAGRLGGEEFALLLPDTQPQAAWERAQALREAIAAHTLQEQGQTFHVTVSIGLATQACSSLDELVRDADRLLYEAKRGGRNRVVGMAQSVS